MAFTEADKKKLLELQEKQRKAKAEERNEQKRNDRMCQKLFGMTVKEVTEKLNGTDSPRDYWNEYYELKCLVERLCNTIHKSYDDFPQYVEWREQKARENNL